MKSSDDSLGTIEQTGRDHAEDHNHARFIEFEAAALRVEQEIRD